MTLHQVDLDAVERIVHRLSVARDCAAMIYVAGNGGSAATASHWVNDLGKATKRSGRVPLKRELDVEWRLDPTHETEYTVESFAEEMAEAGLAVTHQDVRWGEIWAEVVPNDT